MSLCSVRCPSCPCDRCTSGGPCLLPFPPPASPTPQQPPVCFLYLWVHFCWFVCLAFQIPCVRGIKWYLLFSAWLLLLSTIHLSVHPRCCKWQDFISSLRLSSTPLHTWAVSSLPVCPTKTLSQPAPISPRSFFAVCLWLPPCHPCLAPCCLVRA